MKNPMHSKCLCDGCVPLHARKSTPVDLVVDGGGSIFLLCPTSPKGYEWIDDNISADAQRLGNNIAVEHRYITDIVMGAMRDGLKVR